jgi:ATP-dependent helicase/nuclease subunit B
MRFLFEQLTDVCRESPIEEKVLIVPSFAIGRQIVDALARRGTAWFNIRLETVDSLASQVVYEQLSRDERRRLSRAHAIALVERACSEAIAPESYFGQIRDNQGFQRGMRSTLADIRRGGIGASSILASDLEDPRKATDLTSVSDRYQELLDEYRFADSADVLELALETLRVKNANLSRAIYLLPEELELSADERELIDRLAGEKLRVLEGRTSSQPGELLAKSVSVFAAAGAENEIREVLRRVLERRIPLDEVEIVYANRDPYLALVYELCREHDLPATFQDGIPVVFTRPGRAAMDYLEWIARDYDATVLRILFSSLVVSLKKGSGDPAAPGGVQAARLLRKALIGWGRERYLPRLAALVAELEQKRDYLQSIGEATASVEKRIKTAGLLHDSVQQLLSITPVPDERGVLDIATLAQATALFIDKYASVGSDVDAAAAMVIAEVLREIAEIGVGSGATSIVAQRVRETIGEISVVSRLPTAGAIHVSRIDSGGYSDRPHVFIVGLDESRFPGSGVEDPILLDAEREAVNHRLNRETLPILSRRPQERLTNARKLISAVKGELTLTWASFDILQARDAAPSAIVLDVFRIATGNRLADYRDLRKGVPRASFIPSAAALSEREWWLKVTLSSSANKEIQRDSVRTAFPALRASAEAQAARESTSATTWDGFVSLELAKRLDPRENGEPFSASRLETLAICPHKYFLGHVLNIRPIEDLVRDAEAWLEPRQFGQLFHEVLRRFLQERIDAGESTSVEQHGARLTEIARDAIEYWAQEIPPPGGAARDEREKELMEACHIFLHEEERSATQFMPRHLEVPFGLAFDTHPSTLATAFPVSISMRDQKRVLLRGRIDRIDEGASGSNYVWDYKSGSLWGYDDSGHIVGGKRLQHAVYALVTDELTRASGSDRSVAAAGYYFPSRKGQGRRFSYAVKHEICRTAVSSLTEIVAGGVFVRPPTTEPCTFCDYRLVCGDIEKACAQANEKLEAVADGDKPGVDALRQLRSLK